jgi:hypothetical protein
VWSFGATIQARRYASDGTGGDEFQVDVDTTDDVGDPRVAADSNGDFVVVWWSEEYEGAYGTVQGRRFSSGGGLKTQFQVSDPGYDVDNPAVAAASNGGFVVVWASYRGDGDYSIQGRRFSSADEKLDGQFQVNDLTTGSREDPVVAAAADGDFVVIWEGYFESDLDDEIVGRSFASDGTALSGDFRVNPSTTGNLNSPEVAADPDGNFVAIWDGPSPSDPDGGIRGRRYTSGGTALGDEFPINSYTAGAQRNEAVAVDADGDFVVVWASGGSAGSDSDGYSIQGRRFSSSGAALGSQFQVNTDTTGDQVAPAVAAPSDGDFVVVWKSYGSSGNDSIQGQRFLAPAPSGGLLGGLALAGVGVLARARRRRSGRLARRGP